MGITWRSSMSIRRLRQCRSVRYTSGHLRGFSGRNCNHKRTISATKPAYQLRKLDNSDVSQIAIESDSPAVAAARELRTDPEGGEAGSGPFLSLQSLGHTI